MLLAFVRCVRIRNDTASNVPADCVATPTEHSVAT